MTVTIEEIEKFYEERDFYDKYEIFLDELEKALVKKRDNEKVPIYMTKIRIKDIKSVYLKFKRKPILSNGKYRTLSDISDYGGVRVLCMFEQDILPVHDSLLDIVSFKRYKLTEFQIYNWENSNSTDHLRNSIIAKFPDFEFGQDVLIKNKESGYKSIHYVICKMEGEGVEYKIEVQLRTLLQDVWGELEHKISYKQGTIHPHIKKSFQLLSNDLSTNDSLLAHLRNIRDKEAASEELDMVMHAKPWTYFDYEKNLIPNISDTMQEYIDYKKHIASKFELAEKKEWIAKAYELLDKTENQHIKLNPADFKNELFEYWIQMEKSYINFCNGKFKEAMEIYDIFCKRNKDRYVPFFRKGEIKFIQGNNEDALVEFDRCESILEQLILNEFQADSNKVFKRNFYFIKVKIAHTYWSMGEEYFESACKKIEEASHVFDEVICEDEETQKRNELSLKNNICWYNLDLCLSHKNKGPIDNKYFIELERLIEDPTYKDVLTNNAFDTAQWFCYNNFLRENNVCDLKKALDYCKKGFSYSKRVTNVSLSSTLYRSHAQEITTKAKEMGL